MAQRAVDRLRLRVCDDDAALVAATLALIDNVAAAAIAARGRFTIVLSGGNSPLPVYEAARRIDTNWKCWQVYFTDERCVPIDDPQRNDRAAIKHWLGRVPIPASQVHSIPAESGADSAAASYGRTLAAVGRFDLTLLGLGEDGHTASLFPGRPEGLADNAPAVIAVHGAPKPPAERVSLSARRLRDSAAAALIVTGAGKHDALMRLLAGDALPAAAAIPSAGAALLADLAAAGG